MSHFASFAVVVYDEPSATRDNEDQEIPDTKLLDALRIFWSDPQRRAWIAP